MDMKLDTAGLRQIDQAHHLHPFTDFQEYSEHGGRIMSKAEHVYIYDSEGHRMLDGMSGLWCCNLGYSQKSIVEAVYQQMQQLPYYNNFFQCSNQPAAELAKAMVEIANLNYGQKTKLLRHINSLDVDHVILDLGAGSAFHVLDFFLVARKGVLVVVPEPTSVENAYHFLKAAFFRKLKRAEPRDGVRAVVKEVMGSSSRANIRTPRDLISRVWSLDPDVGAALVAEASQFRPALIVNRVDHPSHERLGDDMVAACRDYFGIRLQNLGVLPNDKLVARSVLERKPAALHFQQIPFVTALGPIVKNITFARRRLDD